MAKSDKLENILHELESRIKKQLTEISLETNFFADLLSPLMEETGAEKTARDSQSLLADLNKLKSGANQLDILDIMINQLATRSRRAGLILLTGRHQSFWAGPGFGLASGQKIGKQKFNISIPENSLTKKSAALGEMIVSKYEEAIFEASIYKIARVVAPAELLLIPMAINGRAQAIALVDFDAGMMSDPAELAILVGFAGTCIDFLPFREKIGFSLFPKLGNVADYIQEDSAEESPFDLAIHEPEEKQAPQPIIKQPEIRQQAVRKPEIQPQPKVNGPIEKSVNIPSVIPGKEIIKETPVTPVAPQSFSPSNAFDEEEVVEELVLQNHHAESNSGDDNQLSDQNELMLSTGRETVDDYARELEMQLGINDSESNISIDLVDDTPTAPPAEENPEEGGEDLLIDDYSMDFGKSGEPLIHEDISLLDETPKFVGEDDLKPNFEEDFSGGIELEIGEIKEDQVEQTRQREQEIGEEFIVEPLEESKHPAADSQASDKKPDAGLTYEALGLGEYKLDSFEGEERKQHEKAIRFARLLVSEIKLYNENSVKEGRENGDLLSRLRDDINRSRALYEQRIPAETRKKSDYFMREMVRQLANGDESLMG